jgi:UrcA family protein
VEGRRSIHRFAIAAVAAALSASPAFSAEDAVKMRVNLKGIDLSTDAGAEKALAEITRAARNACTMESTGKRVREIDRACVNDLTLRSAKKLNAPTVLALLEKRNVRQG